jgi:hypothetical protein
MRDTMNSVQVYSRVMKFFLLLERRPPSADCYYIVIVCIICLIVTCGIAWAQAGRAEESAPVAGADQGAVKDHPGQNQVAPPAGPPATIDGFRQARFGMSEEQVRQAIRKDFPGAGAKLSSAVHPSEKTTILSLTATDLLPHTGKARISYILGYHSKKLIQVNILWSSDGTADGDEAVVGTANALRDYFASETFRQDSVVANRQLAENTILVFRGSDDQKRMVLLVLAGVAASARSEGKKEPRPPPLTLELSYIEDAAHPDIFKIGKGQF